MIKYVLVINFLFLHGEARLEATFDTLEDCITALEVPTPNNWVMVDRYCEERTYYDDPE